MVTEQSLSKFVKPYVMPELKTIYEGRKSIPRTDAGFGLASTPFFIHLCSCDLNNICAELVQNSIRILLIMRRFRAVSASFQLYASFQQWFQTSYHNPHKSFMPLALHLRARRPRIQTARDAELSRARPRAGAQEERAGSERQRGQILVRAQKKRSDVLKSDEIFMVDLLMHYK